MVKSSTAKTRARLHHKQNGKCFYCPRPVGVLSEQQNYPVLEHYIPRHQGGRRVVLACQWCDKKKAMIPGPEFEAIIARHTTDAGKPFDQVQQAISAECASINLKLHASYAPNINGRYVSPPRRFNAPSVETIKVVPLPSQTLTGNSGRDKFIADWAKNHKTQAQLDREAFWSGPWGDDVANGLEPD